MTFLQNTRLKMVAILTMVLLPAAVHGQGTIDNAGSNLDILGGFLGGGVQGDLPTVVGIAIRTGLSLVGMIFFILMFYAGYLWMTARGESDQVDKAKKIIIASSIGLVIVVSAYAISVLVTGAFDTSAQ